MKSRSRSILALSVTAKGIGYAILDSDGLEHFGIKSFSSPRTIDSSMSQAVKTIDTLCKKYAVRRVVIRIPSKVATASVQRYLVEQVFLACKRRSILVSFANYGQSVRKIAGLLSVSNTHFFVALSERLPELQRYTNVQNRSQREYYLLLLSAVVIGLAFNRNITSFF